jgi:hypothetical protein
MTDGGRKWETRTGEGSLFANNRKQQDRDADIVGEARFQCPHCHRDSLWFLNGWRREKKQRKPDGSPAGFWYALKVKLKDALKGAPAGGTMPGAQAGAMPGASPSPAPAERPSNVVAMPTAQTGTMPR